MITALLVDDEERATARMRELLGPFTDVEVVGTAKSVTAAQAFLAEHSPSVIFLDMMMGRQMGLDLMPHVRPPTRVIFVTADESFALPAFDHSAVDFLLKPVSRERMTLAITKLRAAIEADDDPRAAADAASDAASGSGPPMTIDASIAIPADEGRSLERVPLVDLLWVRANDNYTAAHFRRRRPVMQRRSMGEWMALLPRPPFQRVDRSLIVNIAAVVKIQRPSRDQAILFFKDVEATLPIGRTAAERVQSLVAW